jgi:hypothetical protein
VRVRRGTRFGTGDVIGTVNQFNHVHLTVGWPGEEHNPLLFRLPAFGDRVRPTIPRGGIVLYDETGARLTRAGRRPVKVQGRVRIVVEAWDRADASAARRRLGLFRLGYQVLHADGRPVSGFEQPAETLRFDRLSPDPAAPGVAFASGSGIPFYRRGRTRFLYQVTNVVRDGVVAEGSWDTDALEPGDYVLRVLAADANGNEALENRDLPVRVGGR